MPLKPDSTTPDGDEENLPLWRQHFPIDTQRHVDRSRREFLGGATIAGGAMVCGQFALQQISPRNDFVSDEANASKSHTTKSHTSLTLDKKFGELDEGEALLFHYPHEKSPCILIKLGNEVVAFQQKCTHLACPVVPEVEANEFHCPCHHGVFDLQTGKPLAGPPREPLPQVQIVVAQDGTLTAIGIQREAASPDVSA